MKDAIYLQRVPLFCQRTVPHNTCSSASDVQFLAVLPDFKKQPDKRHGLRVTYSKTMDKRKNDEGL